MRRRLAWLLALLLVACEAVPRGPVVVDPSQLGPDGRQQGEYAAPGLGVQLVALGAGRFEASLYAGGLPGAGWDGRAPLQARGERRHGSVALTGGFSARIDGEGLVLERPGQPVVRLSRVVRTSPTLGAPPPPGGVPLFGDGAQPGQNMEGERDALGHLAVPARTRSDYSDFLLHVEFRTPFMPESRGQGRGNSGVYLQNRYEVQVLDSFGRLPAADECGALYRQAAPDVAMALPPLQWQTYDIEFRAARFDAAGRKTANARIRIDHNGVRIHDRELEGPTGLGDPETPAPGPIVLQDHWSPVAYRNLWIEPR